MILYLTAGLFGGYNETIKFEELGISTHSLTRRLTTSGWLAAFCSLFQLTASQGGWQGRYRSIQTNMVFQLTASQGGWLMQTSDAWMTVVFQLTASQGGWQQNQRRLCRLRCISTHSLTRRLTGSPHKPIAYDPHFNSQPHKEADQCHRSRFFVTIYFNSQPHKEADDKTIFSTRPYSAFQLTASQGGWLEEAFRGGDTHAFQLTASQGGWRLMAYAMNWWIEISTHSLTRRLTAYIDVYYRQKIISTHSLTRRLTTMLMVMLSYLLFQLTASQGGWRCYNNSANDWRRFQLTASQGGWQC